MFMADAVPNSKITQPAENSLKKKDQLTEFIRQHIPDWLSDANNVTRAAFDKSCRVQLISKAAVTRRVSLLKSPEDFARPLLNIELLARFDETLNIDKNFIKIAHVRSHLFGLFKTTAKATHQTLLQAALQNFKESETHDDGFIEGSMLYARLGTDGWRALKPKPHTFASICRKLNLGTRYQDHIKSIFSIAPTQGHTPYSPVLQPPVDFIEHEKNTFEVMAHIAKMKRDISQSSYEMLLHVIAGDSNIKLNNYTVTPVSINFLLTPLTGPLLFATELHDKTAKQIFVAYLPLDAKSPIKEYISLAQFEARLSELFHTNKARFIQTYIPLRHRSTFSQAARTYYSSASSLVLVPFSVPVFEFIHHAHVARMLDDARTLAVPLEDVDSKTRRQRIQTLDDAGLTLAMLGLSLVPGISEVMLLVAAGQLVNKVYHGVEAWANNNLNAATEYLLDITDTVIEMAATSVVSSALIAKLRTIDTPAFVDNLVTVELPHEQQRLWDVDLAPYQQPAEPPVTAAPNKQRLYKKDHQRYIKLDNHWFEVAREYKKGPWRVKHPTNKDAFSPPLLHNKLGAWRLAQEQPQRWSTTKLVDRLGGYAENLPAQEVEFAMAASNIDKRTLQQIHTSNLPPPGLLIDALKRLQIDRKISRYIESVALKQLPGPESADLLLQLLITLPGWPANKALQLHDGVDGANRIFGNEHSDTLISITDTQVETGSVLSTTLDYLSQKELELLLGHLHKSNTQGLADIMSAYLQAHRAETFNALYQRSEISQNALIKAVRYSYPKMPISLADELIAATSPSEQLHLLNNNNLPSFLPGEADELMEKLNTTRIFEGLYLDSVTSEKSNMLALFTLERLQGWPADLSIEVRQNNADGPVLARAVTGSGADKRVLAKQADTYQAFDANGMPLGQPEAFYPALYQILSGTERSVLGLTPFEPVKTLKQRIAVTGLRTYHQPFAKRQFVHEGTETFEPTAISSQQLDISFSSHESLEGIEPRSDGNYAGIYEKPLAHGSGMRYFIKMHEWTFQVEHSSLGWRLIDARNPFRSYKPLIRKALKDSWELNTEIALKGGGPGAITTKLKLDDDSSLESFNTAQDVPWVEYTPRESEIMRSNQCYQHAQNRLGTYERANNGRYPLSDLDGNPLRIVALESKAKAAQSKTVYSSQPIRPYIKWEGYENVARLYEEKLQLSPFTQADIQIEGEQSLIGQSKVSAKIALSKGEVLGVYGGELIPYYVAAVRKDPYVLEVNPPKSSAFSNPGSYVVLSGTNILSRINTLFEYANGKPVRQASAGYNVEVVPFEVDTLNTKGVKKRYLLTAVFATKAIEPGTELRWNYEYSEEDIKRSFQ